VTPRVLLIEDNREMARSIAYNLEVEGYQVATAHDGTSGLAAARANRPHLVLLDIMLPALDGFAVLERIRRDGFEGPVLILTALGEEGDRIRGFRAGADQYLTKPFGLLELLERVRSLLKRYGARHPAGETFRIAGCEVDVEARTVRRNGRQVTLTPRAFDLLLALYRRKGKVASRAELLATVWGYESEVMSRTVDSHIAELRRKLEPNPSEPGHIVTVWKTGYRLDP